MSGRRSAEILMRRRMVGWSSRSLAGVVLLTLLVELGAVSAEAICTTTIPAGLVADQTWTPAGSPYCVEGDIQVSLLTIEPGVQVLVDGPYEIDVLSTIMAVGTADAPIQFTALTPSTPWHGLKFQNTPAGSQFDYCTFEDSNNAAVSLTNTAPVQLTHSTFRNNSSLTNGGAISAVGATGLVIDQCDFESNASKPTPQGGGGALWIKDGDATITGSLFMGNSATASEQFNVVATGGALFVDGSANVTMERTGFVSNAANGSVVQCASIQAYGGAVYVNSGTVAVRNSVFACNSVSSACGTYHSTFGGIAVYVAGGTVTLEGATIARNGPGAASVQLASAVPPAGGTLQIQDSIFYFNNGDQAQIAGAPTVTYSDVEGGFTGTGN